MRRKETHATLTNKNIPKLSAIDRKNFEFEELSEIQGKDMGSKLVSIGIPTLDARLYSDLS
ncbi:hypothetical protein LPTSP2_33440 [Leptospira ellinghausenii]|uniref:Uncharacterized protein n=1 Tax=Leptospira ellinghausenii TaxID=1917822 RepID=A0A2P2DHF6_9LEPT|nr:hypothetical protein LPTSP2_33440 [Leptospira ellinghausenii]